MSSRNSSVAASTSSASTTSTRGRDPARKRANLVEVDRTVAGSPRFRFVEMDLRDRDRIRELFAETRFDGIVHLAAMAGVRASIEAPALYYDVNVLGTLHLLDAAVGRLTGMKPGRLPVVVFASTSSAYGNTTQIPFVESDPCNGPLAPYAATKRAGELLGYTYAHNFKLPFTALRFFTVYGPRNRPDMMAFKVIDNLQTGREVPLFNEGRDGSATGPAASATSPRAIYQLRWRRPLPAEVINIGRGEPVCLADFIAAIEALAGKKAKLTPAPMPDTDMISTHADISKARRLLDYRPTTSVPEGVRRLWDWYRSAIGG